MSVVRGLAIFAAAWAVGVFALFAAAAHGAEPASEPAPEGERWALLVGINEYQAAGRLQFCREDAQALSKVLVEQGGFSPDRVVVLADGASRLEDLPTRGIIRRSVDQFAKLADPEDTVLVFFSGHGMMAEDETGAGKKGYLMAVDSDRDPANSISIDWLKERLGACKARTKLLILDVCHAGSAKDVGGLAPSMVAGVSGVTVLASCADDEVSYPDEKAGHGVFAARLIEGLSGKADADNDKGVTVSELYTFVRESMKTWSVHSRKQQTPYLWPQKPPEMVLVRVGQMQIGRPLVPARIRNQDTVGPTEPMSPFTLRGEYAIMAKECQLNSSQVVQLQAIIQSGGKGEAVLAILTPEQRVCWLGFKFYLATIFQLRRAELTEAQMAQIRTLCDAEVENGSATGTGVNIEQEARNRLLKIIKEQVLTAQQRSALEQNN